MRLNDVIKQQEELHFSKEMKSLFSRPQRCTYIPTCVCSSHDKVPISYQSIKGKSATAIPERFEEDNNLHEEIPAVPFNNTNTDDKKISKKAIGKIAQLFGHKRTNTIKKHYMVNGGTIPIQIGLGSKTNPFKQIIYVKQPDNSRLLGYELYNLISGEAPLQYCFNEHVFIEEGVQAQPASATETLFIGIPEYKQRFARAAARAELIGMQEDTFKDSNRLIDNNFNTILFDFNIILEEPQGKRHNFLLTQYSNALDGFMDIDTAKAYQDEKKQIARRLQLQIDYVEQLSKVLGRQQFLDYEDPDFPEPILLNDKIEKYYGQPNLIAYIHKRIQEFT
jgi:hypothetical protein